MSQAELVGLGALVAAVFTGIGTLGTMIVTKPKVHAERDSVIAGAAERVVLLLRSQLDEQASQIETISQQHAAERLRCDKLAIEVADLKRQISKESP